MLAADNTVLRQAIAWLDEAPFWLCTIVRTQGSAPRPVGAIAAFKDDAQQVGSISGGCLEEDLLERLGAGEFSDQRPTLIEYGVTADENERLGLPCGGRLTLLLQRITEADRPWLAEVLLALGERRCVERQLAMSNGATTLRSVAQFAPLELDEQSLRQRFGPRMRLLLVGAGQLAQSVAELGLAADYEVVVTDPRQQFLDQWEGPPLQLIQGMPDDVVREHAADRHSAIVTLTHDPRIDDMALMEALGSEAWYVGALGSRRTTEKRLDRLRQLDIPESQINRLHAPVGLAIGSKTPVEIAVAIIAQLIQVRSEARSR